MLEGVELLAAPILVMGTGEDERVTVDKARVAMNVEVHRVVHAAQGSRQALQPLNQKDVVLEEGGRRRPVEGDDRAPGLVVVVGIDAVAAPGVVGLVGVGPEPQKHPSGASWVGDDPERRLHIARCRRLFHNVRVVAAGAQLAVSVTVQGGGQPGPIAAALAVAPR